MERKCKQNEQNKKNKIIKTKDNKQKVKETICHFSATVHFFGKFVRCVFKT